MVEGLGIGRRGISNSHGDWLEPERAPEVLVAAESTCRNSKENPGGLLALCDEAPFLEGPRLTRNLRFRRNSGKFYHCLHRSTNPGARRCLSSRCGLFQFAGGSRPAATSENALTGGERNSGRARPAVPKMSVHLRTCLPRLRQAGDRLTTCARGNSSAGKALRKTRSFDPRGYDWG